MHNYKRPPIIEAVIEVRFGGEALADQVMETLGNKFSERYPAPRQATNNLGFELTGTMLRVLQQNLGFKIHSRDGDFTVSIGRNALGTSKNAPYGGWERIRRRGPGQLDGLGESGRLEKRCQNWACATSTASTFR